MRSRLAENSLLITIALAALVALPACEGSQRAGDSGSGSRGGAGGGSGESSGASSGVAAQQDWGLVVRTWFIDDTRGTQVNVHTPDPEAQAGPEAPWNAAEDAPGSRRQGASNAPSPSPRNAEEPKGSPLLSPLRPDWRAAIAAVAIAPPVDAGTLEAWRANGIELIGVPVERIVALESVLTKVGFRQTQDMGEMPRWTQVCAGPQWNGEQRMVLDNGPVMLGPGRMRMLLRTWVVPGVRGTPRVSEDAEVVLGDGVPVARDQEMIPGAVRVEMAPQHVEAAGSRTSLADLLKPQDADARDGVEGAARAGLILSRLTAAATLDGETALLVLASDAGLAAVGDPTTGGWMAQKPDRAGTTTVGPTMPGDMRLGPAILTSAPDGVGASGVGGVGCVWGQRAWTVLILIPRAPDRYELLGH